MAFFIVPPIFAPHTIATDWQITIAATAVFLVLYFKLFWTGPPWNYVLIAGMAAMGLGLGHINPGACVFIIYTASFIPWAIPKPRWAFVGVAGLVTALGVDAAFFHAPSAFWMPATIVSVGVGFSNTYFAEKNRTNVKLRMAHEEIEHLAKVAERERIARDLHDVLGHTLSLIILKSELASKLADRDPQRAGDEIRDVERISREALSEVRQAVRGYRAGLRQELDGATEMLRTASIVLTTKLDPIPLAPSQEAILALALREAVTNGVR